MQELIAYICITDDKYHKEELKYVPSTEVRWPVDDLRERIRPNLNNSVNLCDALKASEAYERGDGFLPVSIHLVRLLRSSLKTSS